jgi:gliding motility-associated-like protein
MKSVSYLFTALTVCLFTSMSYAQSDDCAGAVQITPSFATCTYQAGSSANATESLPTCSGGGNADDDVWYYFVANSTTMTVEVDPTVGYDAVIELFDGSCATSLQCEDVNGVNGDEVLVATGLTISNTYYFRVYHYGIGSGTSTFNVCVTGLPTTGNSDPCSAYLLPSVSPSCNFLTYTNAGSPGSAVPTPSNCGGSSPFQGGYAGGDVWFEVIVPPSGELDIHTQSVDFTDGAMALYSGPCASPTLLECDDDGEPGDGILMPHIYYTGLTPGASMFIRVWEYGNNNNGDFGICVSTPDNDDCANAQQICDLNGYGGVTSSAYTIDQPSNMCGIGDPLAPTPGCVFGTGYTGASPVQIDNNSWLQFTASSTTAQLFVEIQSCANGNGLQMQIFEGVNCANFIPVSNFLETTTSQTIIATGLTPGNTYYIVVDGFAGDICSYTISATSGVQVVEAIAVNDQLCLGNSTDINAVVTGTGTFTYTWSSNPAGSYPSNATINVSPTVTTEYHVDITGLCGQVTTASVLVTVNNPPTADAGNDVTICNGETTTLSASGGTSYDWDNTLGAGQSHNVSPSSNTTYNVEVTDANGCTATDDVTVNVNPLPTPDAGNDVDICEGESTTITATGGNTYDWNQTLGAGASHTVSPTTTTVYTVTATDGNGCTATDNVTVNVNPTPNAFAGNDITICNGSSVTISASGGTSYDWDNSLGAGQSHTVTPAGTTTYIVTVTDGSGCTATDDITVTVGAALIPSAGTDTSVCLNQSITLFASGGVIYSWEDDLGNVISGTNSVSITPTTSGYYYVFVSDGGSCNGMDSVFVDVNALPIADAGTDASLCIGDTVTISATGGGTYDWDNSLGSGQSHDVFPTGNTTYNVTVTDVNGCTATDDVSIVVNALPTVIASNDAAICAGISTTISASGATTYSWDNSLGSGASHTISPTATTTYTVIGTDGNNCSNSDVVTITVNTPPVIDTSSIQIQDADCVNGGGTISGISIIGQPQYSYVWLDGATVIDTSLVIGALNQGTYILNVTDANGCTSTIDVMVDFADLSTLNAVNDTVYTDAGVPVTTNVSTNDTGDPNSVSILGGPYNGSATVLSNGEIEYTPNAGFVGTDSLVYQICDLVCTSACEQATVYFIIDEILPVDVPNGFSPNGDGYNDIFVILNLEYYPDNEIIIFNRWGDQVFQAAPYNNDWDGTSSNANIKLRGDKVVDGTYFFVLKVAEDIEPINGFVELRTN